MFAPQDDRREDDFTILRARPPSWWWLIGCLLVLTLSLGALWRSEASSLFQGSWLTGRGLLLVALVNLGFWGFVYQLSNLLAAMLPKRSWAPLLRGLLLGLIAAGYIAIIVYLRTYGWPLKPPTEEKADILFGVKKPPVEEAPCREITALDTYSGPVATPPPAGQGIRYHKIGAGSFGVYILALTADEQYAFLALDSRANWRSLPLSLVYKPGAAICLAREGEKERILFKPSESSAARAGYELDEREKFVRTKP